MKSIATKKRLNLNQQYRKMYKSRYLFLFLLPGIIYYIIFRYIPIYGVLIAFKNYNVFDGIVNSPWAANHGLEHFIDLFQSNAFYRIFKNTMVLSFMQIVFTFPMPIILALCLNEVKSGAWSGFVKTTSYMPHFISTVVICGIVFNFLSSNGIANKILGFFGKEKIQFLLMPQYFRGIYVSTEIWQKMGWDSIIFTAALAGVDESLYEAAYIDGASRLQKIIYIDFPSIIPTAVILLIFNIGNVMNMGFEKVILLYNPNTYETADVIGTYVYRRGIAGTDFSFSTAVGLFQSVIGFVLIVFANKTADKLSDISLW